MQQIIGIQRVLQNNTIGSKWNNKKIRWSIVHNINNQSKPYDIQLQMVLVSSKRIVKVNNQIKDTQMCSFGYQSHFDISDQLKGHIKQDSLSFQLYVNGSSFTKLQSSNKAYQPPMLQKSVQNPWQFNQIKKKQIQKKNISSLFQPKTNKQTIVQKTIPSSSKANFQNISPSVNTNTNNLVKSVQFQIQPPKLKQKPINNTQLKQQKKATQNVIKDTQNQLIRILMEQKKKKLQAKKAQNSKQS